jgi:hypothetical protein
MAALEALISPLLLLTYFQVAFTELEQTSTNYLTGDYKIRQITNDFTKK